MNLPWEWQKQTFDAFLVPLEELGLSDREKFNYVKEYGRNNAEERNENGPLQQDTCSP